jgi:hypothetical protein
MAERRLIILKRIQQTPSLATCKCCHLKFFTPLELMREPLEAEGHLREKFASHTCRPSLFASVTKAELAH